MPSHTTIDLTNNVYERLTVVRQTAHLRNRTAFLCKCICGNEHTVTSLDLRSGRVRSCGCLKKEVQRAKQTKFPGMRGLIMVYSAYKCSAKDSNRIFELTKEQVAEIIQMNCSYCGAPPSNKTKPVFQNRTYTEAPFVYNGIDRVDNNIGYVYNNCVPCCAICNRMKKTQSVSDFIEHISRIYEFTLKTKNQQDI